MFKIRDFNVPDLNLHQSLEEFLVKNDFYTALEEVNSNTSNINSFRNRFFRWFDAFRIIKYINFAHEYYYPKVPVSLAVKEYLKNTESVRFYNSDMKKLLLNFREIERNNS